LEDEEPNVRTILKPKERNSNYSRTNALRARGKKKRKWFQTGRKKSPTREKGGTVLKKKRVHSNKPKKKKKKKKPTNIGNDRNRGGESYPGKKIAQTLHEQSRQAV